ncbi:MAG: glycoside hydrolase family 3 N-terminal domain-containing protein, partial [Bacteroidota bacterium]
MDKKFIPLKEAEDKRPDFLCMPDITWAKQTLAKLSLEEKIAQLLHVAAYSNRDAQHLESLMQLTEEEKIGGLIFFQGDPEKQIEMTNALQKTADVPLMISIDGEWGLAMRLNNTIAFPYQIALGAIESCYDDLIYEMGREIGKQCKSMGIHVNFAPTIDINNNPANPVIGFRSFGASKELVSAKAYAYMQGMQDEGILACGKHFPGHGDTDSDSHFTLPVINHSKKHLQENEFYPFKQLQQKGIAAMMVAHLEVPALEPQKGLPSTLSHQIITKQLKQNIGFEGLVFTDALDMKGIAAKFNPGEIEAKAFEAGNDILLFTVDVKKAKTNILQGIENGSIAETEIEKRCLKLLLAKQWAGLDHFKTLKRDTIDNTLQNKDALVLNQTLANKAITMYSNTSMKLPLAKDTDLSVLSISGDPDAEIKLVKAFSPELFHHFKGKKIINDTTEYTGFQKLLVTEYGGKQLRLHHRSSPNDLQSVIREMQQANTKIIALHLTGMKTSSGFGITSQIRAIVNYFADDIKSCFVVFGNVYSLNELPVLKKAPNVIICYQDNIEMQKAAVNLFAGTIKV